MERLALVVAWQTLDSSLNLGASRLQTSSCLGNSVAQRGQLCAVRVRLGFQALQFHCTAEQLISELIELARVPGADAKLPIRACAPKLEALHPVGYLRKIGRALDGIGHRSEEDDGIGEIEVLHRGFDI